MSKTIHGRRVYLEPGCDLPKLQPGEYGKDRQGMWVFCAPVGRGCWFDNFHGCLGTGDSHHKVIEHEDGTITVSPSILVTRHDGHWHGFLERGVWREC